MYYRHKRILIIAAIVLLVALLFFMLFWLCSLRSPRQVVPYVSSSQENDSVIYAIKPIQIESKKEIKINRDITRAKSTDGRQNPDFLDKYGFRSVSRTVLSDDDVSDSELVRNDAKDTIKTANDNNNDYRGRDTSFANYDTNGNYLPEKERDDDDFSRNGIDHGLGDSDAIPQSEKIWGEDVPSVGRRTGYGRPGGNIYPPRKEPQDGNSYDNSQRNPPSPFKGVSSSKQSSPLWIVLIVFLLIVYIFATVISRGGVLVIWAGPLDKALVIVSAVFFFIAWAIGNGQELSSPQITLISISILLMIVSIVFSVMVNARNILNIIISILSKLFVFVLVNFSLLVLIVVLLVYFMIKVAKHSRDY